MGRFPLTQDDEVNWCVPAGDELRVDVRQSVCHLPSFIGQFILIEERIELK